MDGLVAGFRLFQHYFCAMKHRLGSKRISLPAEFESESQ